jgi:hypothetical protein
MRVKSKSNYLGYVFGSLWFIGLFSAIVLAGMLFRNFRSKTSIREEVPFIQPSNNKLLVKVTEGNIKYYGSDWFGFDGEDEWPFYSMDQDSIMMNTIRLKLVRSEDSLYHIYAVKFSSGNTPAVAENLANRIQFPINQADSTLYLPKGFAITRNDKFRAQQVLVVVEIPVNKKIEVDRSLDQYKWFNISMGNRRGWNIEWNDRWDDAYHWNNNVEYLMTPGGLEDIERKRRDEEERMRREERRDNRDNNDIPNNEPGEPGYRYRERTRERRDSATRRLRDSIGATITYEERFKGHTAYQDVKINTAQDIPAPLYSLLKVFQ